MRSTLFLKLVRPGREGREEEGPHDPIFRVLPVKLGGSIKVPLMHFAHAHTLGASCRGIRANRRGNSLGIRRLLWYSDACLAISFVCVCASISL